VFDGKRTLLIATSNGAPRQLDELLGWLGGGPGRWSGLNGRAVISVPGQLPVTVPNESTAVMAAQPDSSDGGDKYSWAWWVAGGVVAVAALGALAILLSARRPSD